MDIRHHLHSYPDGLAVLGGSNGFALTQDHRLGDGSGHASGAVCRALCMAIGQRQPIAGLMLHSGWGSQYVSHKYQALLDQHGIICSMPQREAIYYAASRRWNCHSRLGNCWDNAVMERFFLNLKMERVWRREYANQMEATKDVTDYIVGFYNCQRRHSALGNLAPIDYEKQFAAKQPIEVSEIT